MDVDEFWHLIEESAGVPGGKEARLRWLEECLMRRPEDDIVDFKSWLCEADSRANTNLLAGASNALYLTGGDDSVCYFRMWLIGLGRETFERVVRYPDTLADVPEVRRYNAMQRLGLPRTDEDLPELEELAYVPAKAWERATGKDSALFGRG